MAFESFAVNAVRCKECQKKHKYECEKARYRNKVLKYAETKKEDRPAKLTEVHFLSLPDPWYEGRLPESVTKNQLWGMP